MNHKDVPAAAGEAGENGDEAEAEGNRDEAEAGENGDEAEAEPLGFLSALPEDMLCEQITYQTANGDIGQAQSRQQWVQSKHHNPLPAQAISSLVSSQIHENGSLVQVRASLCFSMIYIEGNAKPVLKAKSPHRINHEDAPLAARENGDEVEALENGDEAEAGENGDEAEAEPLGFLGTLLGSRKKKKKEEEVGGTQKKKVRWRWKKNC